MVNQYNEQNIFAKIIRKEVPATIVYESESILAFKDINPKAKTHILIIPKGNYIDFTTFVNNSTANQITDFFQKINEIATSILGLSHFKLHINNGENSGQEVFHFHVHLISSQSICTDL